VSASAASRNEEETVSFMMKFQGILPAIVTPFDKRGNFASAAFERLMDHVYRSKVDGVWSENRICLNLQGLPSFAGSR